MSEHWNWQLLGRCRQHSPEMFFPEEESRRRRWAMENAAKEICLDCPVLTECRSHALKTPELYGVWGAMTAAERAR